MPTSEYRYSVYRFSNSDSNMTLIDSKVDKYNVRVLYDVEALRIHERITLEVRVFVLNLSPPNSLFRSIRDIEIQYAYIELIYDLLRKDLSLVL